MKTRLLITIGIITIFIGSLGLLAFSQEIEIECLRLYKDIRELSRTPEMSLAERETINSHKNLVFAYVEKNCPNFPDLEFIHNNYKQNISESEDNIEKEHIEISLYRFKPSISVGSPINDFTIKIEGYYPKPHAPDIQIVNETGHVIWTNYDDIGHVILGRTGSVDFCKEYQFYDIGDPIIFNSTGTYKFIFTFEEFSLDAETIVRQNTAGGTFDNPNFHCD